MVHHRLLKSWKTKSWNLLICILAKINVCTWAGSSLKASSSPTRPDSWPWTPRGSVYHHCTSSMESVAMETPNYVSERGSATPENTNLQLFFSYVKFREFACVCSAAGVFFFYITSVHAHYLGITKPQRSQSDVNCLNWLWFRHLTSTGEKETVCLRSPSELTICSLDCW